MDKAAKSSAPECKDILIRKLSFAVICSVLSQVIVLFVLLFIVNFDVYEPLKILKSTLQTFTLLSTWIYIVPFSSVIFAQSLVCAKDYVLTTNCNSTRIQKFLCLLSLRNLVVMGLYILIGGIMVWLFLTLGGGRYENLTVKCKAETKCVVEGSLFLILSGLWTGLYYFAKVYSVDKKILFPVIYQSKFIQLKSKIMPLLSESRKSATAPTMYFLLLYYVLKANVLDSTMNLLNAESYVAIEDYGIFVYMWLFTVLYFLSMNLMRFFFELFLTEPITFPIVNLSKDSLCLADAITFTSIPIIQNLACLDMFILSQWSKPRRSTLFSLSQPGGHPHNWNYLIQNSLKLITDYCECLNKATYALLNPESKQKIQENIPLVSPLPVKFRNIRNMTIGDTDYDIVNIAHDNKWYTSAKLQNAKEKLREKVKNSIAYAKKKLGIDYLFGELPEANIQYCLGNAQVIMWTTQGLSFLAAASLKEDRYGIVQKDLPVIITTLVELKNSIEKLNRVPILNRKSVFNDFNVRMKTAINASVKRSIFGICHSFGQYLKDLPLSKDVLQHLQLFMSQKTM